MTLFHVEILLTKLGVWPGRPPVVSILRKLQVQPHGVAEQVAQSVVDVSRGQSLPRQLLQQGRMVPLMPVSNCLNHAILPRGT